MVLGFVSAGTLASPFAGALFRTALGRTCRVAAPARRTPIWRTQTLRMMTTEAGGGEDTVMSTVEQKLKKALEPTKLVVEPTYGDPNGAHVSIYVVSEAFEGQNVVKRHRTVYGAIWDELQGPIHAVDQLVTKTPAEEDK